MAAVAAGHTVLTPNTELAAALFDAAERMYQESGREIWPTPDEVTEALRARRENDDPLIDLTESNPTRA